MNMVMTNCEEFDRFTTKDLLDKYSPRLIEPYCARKGAFGQNMETLLERLDEQLMFLAYLFFLVWLGVTAFTSLPVFMYFNVWSMCQNTSLVEGANLCLDLRQFGAVTISEERKVCAGSEKFFKMCESNELDLTFHLFVCALAGAGAAVIAMVHFLMALAANWGYLKDASRMQKWNSTTAVGHQVYIWSLIQLKRMLSLKHNGDKSMKF
ncbi:hypothetical protein F2P81_010786 [Scophthalmus maximus]|uniref:Neuronal membrane glycoprotein M6-a n=1 Tax=Scophthalmus maximus TaxID=52904 RepID=A0A6A4T6U0_SCOMX|nr:hypothetical protein F2P81_010786 [Scophthalmus maximus]